MTKKEYEYLKERSRVIQTDETAGRQKERLAKESIERKEAFRRMDMKKRREKDPKTKEIEEEARNKMMHILERAHNMRLEQEEEIKKCNQFILAAKCRAIRDAQVTSNRFYEFQM